MSLDTSDTSDASDVEAAVAAAFQSEWGQVVATLIRVTGDWDLAEDSAADAFTTALERWKRDGIPRNPGAWLTTTARNRATDRIRHAARGTEKLRDLALLERDASGEVAEPDEVHDDRLRLIFTCCHPALPFDARIALTLRTLTGLTTAEIARAFLVPEPTMYQRLTRAKRKIREANIPYRVPPPHLLQERLSSVLAVVYLLFNEGYSATTGADLIRQNLSGEAIRLARLLVQLLPEPESLGLLALMLLHDARRSTRVDDDGALVTLERQDRSRWDRARIAEGLSHLRATPGPYQLQAAIAAVHAIAPTVEATDWAQIVALYDDLLHYTPSPVVRLNRAVAVAMADGPAAGLKLVDELVASGELDGYHLLPATRADLLRRQGASAAAAEAYREAIALAATDAERAYLTARLDEL
ncbi:RNA polymerase sigma factor [Tenggerimyces flavus]|uniref:RNA polymerase sigma factor n=1 Tax=Tenggerimyces flavus TaxID=1708749 RepID=A0ABV7Y7H7_9ACTN|nr:sigma-70 family RNA polymerase sigma factor [Tenggerimyces flavus]MBM7785016.1 RNA polymerase sigma-70 factor (ECF subfamily) [Tenggerimyces flavus]